MTRSVTSAEDAASSSTSCRKLWVDAQLAGAFLKNLQKLLAADAGEAMPTADELAAAEMDGNIVPVMEIPQYRAMRLGVGSLEIPHGLVGKHHAPAESVIGPVTLVDLDSSGRQSLAQQDGRVQPRRAAAQTDDSLHCGSTPHKPYHKLQAYVILPIT